jgi:phosphoglycolate phosphatase
MGQGGEEILCRARESLMIHQRSPLLVSAVALDLDGTLVDTAEDIADAIDAALVSLDLAPLGPAVVRGLIGQGFAHLVKSALTCAAHGVEPTPELVGRAQLAVDREYTAGLSRRSVLYPGAQEGLDLLRTGGFPLACVTNKPKRFTTPLLEALHLSRYFALVIAGDTLAVKKPDPGQLIHACHRLGTAPDRLLVVGDSIHDLHAARAAGCPVFCVTYGYTEDPAALARQADAAVDSVAEVAVRIVRAESTPGFAPASGSGTDSGPEF